MREFQFFLSSVANDLFVLGREIVFSPLFIAFLAGAAIASLSTAFIVARSPHMLSCVVRFDRTNAFQVTAPRTVNGTFTSSFFHFKQLYEVLHTLILAGALAIICFTVAVVFLYR